jgi:DNA (cytosine-5)-methyltransferase 1
LYVLSNRACGQDMRMLRLMKNRLLGIDLFSGAGGMSEGAILAGVDVRLAIEKDKHAAITYNYNHPNTVLVNDDIRKIRIHNHIYVPKKLPKIIFGGPPCQGFSTSNQKTRNKSNQENWLFKEYVRIVNEVRPDWAIVENVKGILETESGYFFEKINHLLRKIGYTCTYAVLNAKDYGVPQCRQRIFIVASLHGIQFQFPKPTHNRPITVEEAISDLPKLENGANELQMDYFTLAQSRYQKLMRKSSKSSLNNLVTKNNRIVINRYKHIPQGGNWQHIPAYLMKNYKDFSRCHTGIYHRLIADQPSVVIGNYRKNMLIHPFENRGLSVREAARLQSFPDAFQFFGSIGFQQQQVGNSVPPLLAKSVFKEIVKYY